MLNESQKRKHATQCRALDNIDAKLKELLPFRDHLREAIRAKPHQEQVELLAQTEREIADLEAERDSFQDRLPGYTAVDFFSPNPELFYRD